MSSNTRSNTGGSAGGKTGNGPRVFTLEEVNALVPELARVVGRQLERRSAIQGQLRAIGDATGDVPQSLTVATSDSTEVRGMKEELAKRVAEYQDGWREVEGLGGVLKDARLGLVDFYGHVDGRLVWLCWRFGENEVRHYHALDEGFSARREIRTSLRIRHLN